MKLSQARVGAKVKVTHLGEDKELALILLGLGLVPGDVVEVVQKAPFGSPIALKKNTGHYFALRGTQAQAVAVELLGQELIDGHHIVSGDPQLR